MRRTLLVLIAASIAASGGAVMPAFASSTSALWPRQEPAPAQPGQPAPPGQFTTAAPSDLPTPLRMLIAQRGSITGQVRVAGVPGRPDICVVAVGPSGVRRTRVAVDGRFVVAGLLRGQYLVRYQRCGTPEQLASRPYADPLNARRATKVLVEPGRIRHLKLALLPPATPAAPRSAQIKTLFSKMRAVALASARATSSDQPLAKYATIKGTVTSKAGRPIPGVCVVAFRRGGPQGDYLFGAVTSATGSYAVHSRYPGRFEVFFDADCGSTGNYAPQAWPGKATAYGAKEIPLKVGQTVGGINARLGVGARMSGQVRLGSASGAPLSGICVQAAGVGGQEFFGGGAATGADGRFVLPSLGTGSYEVEFSPGCSNGGLYAPRFIDHPVAVTVGRTTTGVSTYLVPDGTITGTLTDSGGHPVGGICVAAFPFSAIGFGVTSTGNDGSFTMTGLPPGEYDVTFGGCENDGNLLPTDQIASVASAQSTRLDVVMPTGGIIKGTVRDSAGHPVPGVCVQPTGLVYGAPDARTGPDGTYTLRQLEPDSYDLLFASCGNQPNLAPQYYKADSGLIAPTPVPVAAGQVRTGVDVVMRRGAAMTGRVTSTAGQALSGSCVMAFTGGPFYGGNVVSTAGRYQMAGLAPGQYNVGFCGSRSYARQFFRGRPTWDAADLISLPAGITRGVSAVLPHAGAVTGSVRDQAGDPLSSVCVGLVSSRDNIVGFATTGRRGSYRIGLVSPGRYRVEFFTQDASGFSCSAKDYATTWYPGRAQPTAAKAVRVTAGHTTSGIGAVLKPGGAIAGRVVYGTDGRPVANACVVAYNGVSNGAVALTDRRGDYVLRGLSTGSYTIEYVPCAYESSLGGVVRQASVRVVAGETTRGVTERLALGGTITGAVQVHYRGRTGPGTGICVVAVPVSGSGFSNYWVTNDDGTYQLDNLAPGQYRVYAGEQSCSYNTMGLVRTQYQGLVTVTAGQVTSGIDVLLGQPGAISGIVRGATGSGNPQPVAGICVVARPTVPGASPVIGITTSSGGYAIAGLPQGGYRVEFEAGCGATGYATQWYSGASSEQQATVVHVGQAATTAGIDATLRRG